MKSDNQLWHAAYTATQRCNNSMHPQFADYGGRGIEVRFISVTEFAHYLQTLDGCRNELLVLDRKDNDGHYERGNLQFVTWVVSNRNKRRRNRDRMNFTPVSELLIAEPHYLSNLRGKLTQAELAKQVGVTRRVIIYVEYNELHKVSEDALVRVLQAYIQLEPVGRLAEALEACH